MGPFVFASKVATCMHTYSRTSYVYYDYNSQDKRGRRGKQEAAAETRVLHIRRARRKKRRRVFFFFFLFSLVDFLLSLFFSFTRFAFPFRSRFEDGLPLLAFIATIVASSAQTGRIVLACTFRTPPPFLQALCANTFSRHRRHLRKGQAVLMPRAAVS